MADCCGKGDVLFLACSGGCNVGQLTNDAAKALDEQGQGSFYCLAGFGARVPMFIERGQKAGTTLAVIDGCPVACGRKTLEGLGVPVGIHVVVTELGIEKGHHFRHTKDEVAQVAQAVTDALNGCCS